MDNNCFLLRGAAVMLDASSPSISTSTSEASVPRPKRRLIGRGLLEFVNPNGSTATSLHALAASALLDGSFTSAAAAAPDDDDEASSSQQLPDPPSTNENDDDLDDDAPAAGIASSCTSTVDWRSSTDLHVEVTRLSAPSCLMLLVLREDEAITLSLLLLLLLEAERQA